ncbi:hypothetical protein NIES2104_57510 [Leptolyngbya sp. NIES-2104]|nr:hypothetical protein NIES2104_57510 [Leptolyngbya sp. NIES-2104]
MDSRAAEVGVAWKCDRAPLLLVATREAECAASTENTVGDPALRLRSFPGLDWAFLAKLAD